MAGEEIYAIVPAACVLSCRRHRSSRVIRAKRSFVNLLTLPATSLCEEKDNYAARCVFSTCQTMMNCIGTVEDQEGRLFPAGHIDPIVYDTSRRLIRNNCRNIFNCFDALLV